ncbi:hypothetical protein RJ640_009573 [Escallonia rubra]|uniref:TPX2 C-terminal domain-containing protein n=1 Tax=Escallonia rubra TaxID=112253 RepID=A0AA88UFI9_9ASTE|nr:hypothetical protein RJ640_009573 [Escallonia rubra]
MAIDPIQLIMETPNTKSAQKYMKSSSQTAVPASARVVRSSSPEQQPKNNSSVLQKPLAKENTKPVEIKLHTQQRAVKRAIFNYSVATKLYLMEQQKKQVEKLQKILYKLAQVNRMTRTSTDDRGGRSSLVKKRNDPQSSVDASV